MSDHQKQFDYDETLLTEGRYREWFYAGLEEGSRAYLRQPARDAVTHKCYTCKEYKPLLEFTKNEWDIPDRFRCNTCLLTSKGRNGHRYINNLPFNWQKKAACVGQDPVVFFPNSTEAYRNPKAAWRKFCPGCPVKDLCLRSAQESGDVPSGIFGGVYFDNKGRRREDAKSV